MTDFGVRAEADAALHGPVREADAEVGRGPLGGQAVLLRNEEALENTLQYQIILRFTACLLSELKINK